MDGVDLGAEVLTPPYTTTWNTGQVSNGTHTVRAIARDLAENSASGSASVTVSNATNSLVAAYGFSEGSGTTVTDASVYGNTGTISGGSWTGKGRFGSALRFDGASWVTVNDSDSLDLSSGMTLEAWVYPTVTTGTWATIAFKEAPPGGLAYHLQGDPSNRPSSYVTTDAGGLEGIIAAQALPLNNWAYLAATYNGSVLFLYNNGTVVASAFVSGNILNSGGPFRLGGNSIFAEYFVGTIDEVRIYSRALSQAEILADMTTPIVVPTPTPTPAPPSITQQPRNATVIVGQTATFRVKATGAPPLRYQWRKNGTNIAGATSPTYVTPPTTPADNGARFSVVVRNSVGSVTSKNAQLKVEAGSVLDALADPPLDRGGGP